METMELRSPAFNDHAPIPARHAKDGEDLSPALEWSGVPEGSAELALICEDPDAPEGMFIHWAVACIDPSIFAIAEDQVPPGAVEGSNDYGDQGYGGPRPPIGDDAHRYFFRLFAVSEPLGLSPGFTANELRQAMEGKEVARGTLVGTYQR
jgi:Raf kinase inhibitor-like YbhB/YbcL family protein